jgi:hypothetical protein
MMCDTKTVVHGALRAVVAMFATFAILSTASCTQPTASQSAPAPQPEAAAAAPRQVSRFAPPAVDTTTQLTDANGNVLGYAVSSSATTVELFTLKGYLVSIDWNGALLDGIVLYTGPDGAGTAFFQWSREYALRGFVTAVGGQAFVPASTDADGLAIPDPDITSYQSYFFDGATSTIPATPVLGPYSAYRLKPALRAEIGLPDSPPLPLQLVSR